MAAPKEKAIGITITNNNIINNNIHKGVDK
jgi:hypothetical protein